MNDATFKKPAKPAIVVDLPEHIHRRHLLSLVGLWRLRADKAEAAGNLDESHAYRSCAETLNAFAERLNVAPPTPPLERLKAAGWKAVGGWSR